MGIMRHLASLAIAVSLLAIGAVGALAADGTAVGVNPQAVAELGSDTRTLVAGADVTSGERVVTGPSGQVQILFDDQTRLVVGPGSSLVIDEYLKRGNRTAGKVAISALSGTFRFVTGKSAKSAYEIKTPTGAIGVRGTAFDFNVASEGTIVMLYHGSVRLCNTAQTCVTLDKKCEVGTYDLAEAFVIGRDVGNFEELRHQFRYSVSQAPLLRDFRVAESRNCLVRTANEGAPPSLGEPSSGGDTIPTPGRALPAPPAPVPPRVPVRGGKI
jgi:hypothetical protein